MAALLESPGVVEPRQLRRGEVVEGTVMAVERDGVLVDIGFKSEGVVPTQEMHSMGADPLSKIHPGEQVLVFVVQPETQEGQVALSIDRARGEQGWRTLQERFESGEIFEAEITGYNKGGLLANVEGVNAFIPMSQVVGAKPGSDGANPLSAQVGRVLRLKVIEINRRRNRVILSERAALQEWRAEQKDRLLAELTEGEIRTGTVTSIRNFGVFVDLGGADGLVHLSELSWDRNAQPEDLFKVSDEVKVYVMRVDEESKKIALSIRRASPEQWEEPHHPVLRGRCRSRRRHQTRRLRRFRPATRPRGRAGPRLRTRRPSHWSPGGNRRRRRCRPAEDRAHRARPAPPRPLAPRSAQRSADPRLGV